MKRTLVLMTTALLAVAGLAGSAAAAPPEREVLIDEGVFLLPDFDCGTFTLHEELISERIEITTFFDRDGGPIREQVTVNFRAEITKSPGGETFQDIVIGLDTFDLVTGEASFVGPGFRVTVPGRGIVLLHTGRKIFDADGNVVFNAGPDEFDKALMDAVCGALA
jgi:hypothetical protein